MDRIASATGAGMTLLDGGFLGYSAKHLSVAGYGFAQGATDGDDANI